MNFENIMLSEISQTKMKNIAWAHLHAAAAAAKSLQSCPTLCDPTDGSQPTRLPSPVPGILQARTLEWVAISFSDAWKWKVKVKFTWGTYNRHTQERQGGERYRECTV